MHHRMLHTFRRFGIGLTILILLHSCCGPDPYRDYFKYSEIADPKSLDPALSTDVFTAVKIAILYDNLVKFGVGSEILPSVARSWEISDDGTRYTFHLQSGFRFINGREITAEDVKYSFERVLNPATNSPMIWLFTPITGSDAYAEGKAADVSGLIVEDSLTLVIQLTSPFAPFLGFLAMPAAAIVAPEGVAAAGDRFSERPLGSGPWILEEWKHDNFLSFRPNTDYFFGAPKLKGFMVRIIPEVLTMAVEFESGNLDLMTVPTSEFIYWTHSNTWKPYIQKFDELAFYYLGLNCERKPFDNPRVREAASLAIDRDKIVDRILHGSGEVANGPIPPALLGHNFDRPVDPYDPERARQILIEEGYADGCEFELWADQDAGISQTLEAIQSYLNDAGFKARIIRNDWNMMRDAMRRGKTDAYWGNWWADYADAENFLAPLFQTNTAARRNRYSNPVVDTLIVAMQKTLNDSARAHLAMEIDSIIAIDRPYLFMWYPTTYTVVQPWVRNYQVHLMYNANKYSEVWFDRSGE